MTDVERFEDAEIDGEDDEQDYEPDTSGEPLIIPELDGKGGTIFKVGDQEFATAAEAQASIAPDEEDVDEDEVEGEYVEE